MSNDQRFEREARAWLELGPTEAPDRMVEATLLEIETTSQVRGFRVPLRLPIMKFGSRLAAVAIVAVVAVGVAFVFFRPSTSGVGSANPTAGTTPAVTAAPTETTPAGSTMAEFKFARDAVCSQGVADKAPLRVRFLKIFDLSASEAERADGLVALDAFITLDAGVIDQLAALEAPADLRDGHIANVTQFRDELTLVRRISTLVHAGDTVSAQAVDASTDDLNGQILKWEGVYNFNNCP